MRRPSLLVSVVRLAWLALATPLPAATVTVLGEDGAPVAGAVARWAGGGARSDDSGLLVLDGLVAPACLVAPGHVPLPLGVGLEADGTLTLGRAVAVGGRVATPDGDAAAGVTLSVQGDEGLGPCARAATSDASGAWVIDGIEPGATLRLAVSTPPAFVAPEAEVLARATTRPRRLDVVVLPAVAARLTVTGADGRPLAGAVARVQPAWDALRLPVGLGKPARARIEAFEGTTDAAGIVDLLPLPRGATWRLVVRHPQHAPASLALALKAETKAALLAMRHGGTLAVHAVDETAADWPGATARLTSSSVKDVDLVPAPAPAKDDGVVRLTHVPAGRYALEVRAPGARPWLRSPVVVRDGETTTVGEAVLEPGASLSGTVVGDGAPLAGALVTLWTTAEGASLRLETTTGKDGAFFFEGLDPEATADLVAKAEGWTGERMRDVATSATGVTLAMERAATLVVVARDAATQEPLTDLTISMGEQGGVLETQRRDDRPDEVRVEGLAPGTRGVVIRAPGRAPSWQAVELAAGEETRVSVELSAGVSVDGRVVEAGTGAGIGLATIEADGQGVTATSRLDGSFTLEGLRVPFDVTVTHDTFVKARVPRVEPALLPDGLLVVALERGGSVAGTVYGADGLPLEGAEVADRDADRTAVADAAGAYRLDGVPPGDRILRKTDRPGTFDGLESAVVTVVAGGLARRDFGGGMRLTGVVTYRGEPVRGVRVGVMPVGMSVDSDMARGLAAATTGADGRYAVALAQPGEHAVTVSWRGHRFGRRVVAVEGAGTITEDIAIPELHVTGRVIDAETGAPVEGAELWLRPAAVAASGGSSSIGMASEAEDGTREQLDLSSDPASVDESAADGSFTLLVDVPGPAAFSAWVEGYDPWKAPDDFAVTTSLDGVTVSLTRKSERRMLRVRLVDEATRGALSGTIVLMTRDPGESGFSSTRVMSGAARAECPAPVEGGSADVLGWSAGKGMDARRGLTPTGEDMDVILSLAPGGSVRLVVPDGVLLPDAQRGFAGDLHVLLPGGMDVGSGNINAQMNVLREVVSQTAPGEWIVRDLPAGPVGFALGSAPPVTIEVIPGEMVDADLR